MTGPDFDAPPTHSIVFDDGSGPKLFMAGQFQQAGGLAARSIARLDDTGWNNLGGGTGATGSAVGVYALEVFDEDGAGPGGPALFAAGLFETMSGVSSRSIAKWDGAAWHAVGNGIWGSVRALVVHDDGTGPALYAAGSIQLVNGGTPHGLVKLSGGVWSTVPGWTGGSPVNALASHDDGGGQSLFVATQTAAVHRWSGGTWVDTGAPTTGGSSASCFATFADASGSRLYFGSGTAGGLRVWDGTAWAAVANADSSFGSLGVRDLTVWDDGTGEALYVMGELQGSPNASMSGIAKYRNGQWTALGTGLRGSTQSFTAQPIPYEGGECLFVAGYFTSAGGLPSRYSAVWTGATWLARGRAQFGSGIASTTWDDGSVERAYSATTSTTGQGSVAAWDGSSWTDLPGGVNWNITRMAGVSGGTTPGVYVTGPFSEALNPSSPAVRAPGIARWDGSAWSGLGGFWMAAGLSGRANSVCSADLGDGPALYVGGQFDGVGGTRSLNIGALGSGGWTGLGLGVSGTIYDIERFDDGTGMATYAVGNFNQAGGAFALWAARWNGTAWTALTAGLPDMPRTLVVHDDGTGPALYAGGAFDTGTGSPAVMRWNGTMWQPVGMGSFIGGGVMCLLSKSGPGGNVLYAAGGHADANFDVWPVVAWNGTSWSTVGPSGMGGEVMAIAFHDDGTGEDLYAAGRMTSTGSTQIGGVARLTPGGWVRVGGLDSVQGNGWRTLASYDAGTGAKLYVGGHTNTIPLLSTRNSMICWDGSAWSTPAGGVPDIGQAEVNALLVHDDGSGPRLLVGGKFAVAGTTRVSSVASFDGTAWSARTGVSGAVWSIHAGTESGLPKLWFGGQFNVGDVTPASGVARYKDGVWEALGTGVHINGQVYGVAAHDTGSGVELAIGGDFTGVGGTSASNIATWDGSAWSGVGAGCNDAVMSVASYDGKLFAGGRFTQAGGQPIGLLASWDGSAWASVGGGVSGAPGRPYSPGVYTMTVADDGAGDALFVGGEFTSVGGSPAARAARWDGTNWSALDEGLNDTALFSSALPTGGGIAIAFSGPFSLAGGASSMNTAIWEPCALRAVRVCPADFNGDDFLDFFDYDDFVYCFETGSCPAGRDADFNGDDFVDFFDYDDFVAAFETGC